MEVNNPLSGTSFEPLGYMVGILPFLLEGAYISIKLALVGLLLGLFLGLPLALAKAYGKGLLKSLSIVYIEVIRGTPLLLQLFIVYFGLPEIGIQFDRTVAVWVALGINSAAYQAEYIRGALNAIDTGQITAAKSMGLSPFNSFRYILLPQLVRIGLPAWSNEVIYIVKYAAVAFTVAIPDLLARGKMLTSWHFKPVEVFIVVALIYVILLSVISSIMQLIERRLKIPGLVLEKGRE